MTKIAILTRADTLIVGNAQNRKDRGIVEMESGRGQSLTAARVCHVDPSGRAASPLSCGPCGLSNFIFVPEQSLSLDSFIFLFLYFFFYLSRLAQLEIGNFSVRFCKKISKFQVILTFQKSG